MAACVWSGAARAKEQTERPRAQLDYVRKGGAKACPDEETVRRGVTASLGYDPFVDPGASAAGDHAARIRCTLTRRSGEWRAQLVVLDGDGQIIGERKLASESADCAELASTVELAITIAVDPLYNVPPEPVPAPEAEPESAPPPATPAGAAGAPPSTPAEPSPTPPVERDDLPPPVTPLALPAPGTGSAGALPDVGGLASRGQSRPRWSIAGGVVRAVGVQPGVSTGFSLGGGVQWNRWSVLLEGRLNLPSSQTASGGTVTVSTLAASGAGCRHFGPMATCVVGTGGALFGQGDFDIDGAATTRWIAFGARESADLPLSSSWGLRLSIEVLTVVARTTLKVSDVPVWETPWLSGSFGAALVGALP